MTGQNRVDANPVGAVLAGHLPSHADDRGFGRLIHEKTRSRQQAVDRRDVDDAPGAALDHLGHRKLDRPVDGLDHDVHAGVPVLFRNLNGSTGPGGGHVKGVVDQDVQPSPFPNHPLHGRLQVFSPADVGPQSHRGIAGRLNLPDVPLRCFQIDVGDQNRGPRGGHATGNGASQSLGASGHDGHLVLQSRHHSVLACDFSRLRRRYDSRGAPITVVEENFPFQPLDPAAE